MEPAKLEVVGDAEVLPKMVDEVDALQLEKAQLEMQALAAKMEALKSKYDLLGLQLAQKYKIDLDKDHLDLSTRKIVRGAK